ncbi:hypothetical protein MJ047_11805, partial [Acinetobacter baumannii]|nr:hypothetical protein [Acinetobacter baumannii]
VRGIANSKIGFGDLILLLRYFFKLKVSTHPKQGKTVLNLESEAWQNNKMIARSTANFLVLD